MKIYRISFVENFPLLCPGGNGNAHAVCAQILHQVLKWLEIFLPGTQKGQGCGFQWKSFF
jgi:hypothetical protein